jgi:hypothetical protein
MWRPRILERQPAEERESDARNKLYQKASCFLKNRLPKRTPKDADGATKKEISPQKICLSA